MAWTRSLTGVALLTIVASLVKAAPASFGNHGDHGHHPVVLVEPAYYESLALPMPELQQGLDYKNFQEANIERRQFFKPYFFYPYILSHPNHPLNNPYPELAETVQTDESVDDEIPITPTEGEVTLTSDEEVPETIDVARVEENKPEAQLDGEDGEVIDRKHDFGEGSQ